MARKTAFFCDNCDVNVPKWLGKCPSCGQWGTISETSAPQSHKRNAPTVTTMRITDIDSASAIRIPTHISEFDRVLGGGLVAGSVILLAGEPGVGKSTLLLSIAKQLVADETHQEKFQSSEDISSSKNTPVLPKISKTNSKKVLYITGEESAGQVRLRAERISALNENIFLAAETELSKVLAHIHNSSPDVIIVDSVQTLSTEDTEGVSGGVNQVKAITAALSSYAKAYSITMILVGHVTKDGSIAGPRTLEHLVDVVLHFEGDKNSSVRLIRGIKNRYGTSDEIGCFEQKDDGIYPVDDPTILFLQHRHILIPGSAITVALDGQRALLTEVQALVAVTNNPTPRRAVSGVDPARLSMILAVLDRRCRVSVTGCDVYAATVGGVKLTEPAVDLALALAAASATMDRSIHNGLVIMGEVGLTGEVRPVRGTQKRILEAARLGFSGAIVPKDTTTIKVPTGFTITEVSHVSQALQQGLHRTEI